MKNFLQLIGREFRLFYSNKVLLVLFIGAPIMYGVLIGNVYKKGKVTDLGIIVVDEDRSTTSQRLIQMIDDNEVTNVIAVVGDDLISRQMALERDAPCVVYIPKDFEKSIFQKRYPEIIVYTNAANTLTANFAANAINLSAATLRAGIEIEALKKQGVPPTIAANQYEPFRITFIKENIRSNNYLYFMLPGVLLTVLQQVLLLGLALSFSAEYENGTFSEIARRMPNAFGLIWVKTIPYILMSIGIFVLYYFFSVIYRMPLQLAFWPFILSSILFILAVCAMGVLVSIILPSQLKSTEVLMVVATPSFILSGFTWPLSQMPGWVQTIADIIPLTHYLKIFRVLVIEHGPVSLTRQPIYALGIIFVVCLVFAWVVLAFKIRKERAVVNA